MRSQASRTDALRTLLEIYDRAMVAPREPTSLAGATRAASRYLERIAPRVKGFEQANARLAVLQATLTATQEHAATCAAQLAAVQEQAAADLAAAQAREATLATDLAASGARSVALEADLAAAQAREAALATDLASSRARSVALEADLAAAQAREAALATDLASSRARSVALEADLAAAQARWPRSRPISPLPRRAGPRSRPKLYSSTTPRPCGCDAASSRCRSSVG